MLIAHSSDHHLDERDPRFPAMVKALRAIVAHATNCGAELFLWAGDLSGRDSAHRWTVEERMAWAEIISEASEVAPSVIIPGNHCAPGEYPIFERLRTRFPIIVADKISCHTVATQCGNAHVSAFPYLPKTALLNGDRLPDVTRENALAAERYMNIGWKFPDDDTPRIAIGHFPAEGAGVGDYEITSANDVVVSRQAMDRLPVDYGALGHIHERQQVANKWHYSGDPYQLTHGESGAKGYLLVNVVRGQAPEVMFSPIESWSMRTIQLEWLDDKLVGPDGWDKSHVENQHIKIRIKTPPDLDPKRLKTEKLKERILALGALSVDFKRDTETVHTERMPELREAKTDDERLSAVLRERVNADRLPRLMERFGEIRSEG